MILTSVLLSRQRTHPHVSNFQGTVVDLKVVNIDKHPSSQYALQRWSKSYCF